MGARCMAWWRRGRRGRRGCGPDSGAGAGLDRERLSRAESAVTLEVPRPGCRCLWGALSADIPENAPHRRGPALGRRVRPGEMTQQSPQHQGHLVTGPGHSARGGDRARCGGSGTPSVPGQADRGRRCAVRGGPIGAGGAAGLSCHPVAAKAPDGRRVSASYSPGACLPRRSAFPGACLPPRDLPSRRLPSPRAICLPRRLTFPGACLTRASGA